MTIAICKLGIDIWYFAISSLSFFLLRVLRVPVVIHLLVIEFRIVAEGGIHFFFVRFKLVGVAGEIIIPFFFEVVVEVVIKVIVIEIVERVARRNFLQRCGLPDKAFVRLGNVIQLFGFVDPHVL